MKLSSLKLSLLSLTLAVSMGMTGCDKASDSAENSKATEGAKTETSANDPATQIAETTLDNVSMITLMYRSADGVTDEQKACLDKINMQEIVPDLAKMFKDNFTKEELQQTADLYNKPEIKQVTKYALQMTQKMAGIEVKDPVPAPSPEDMKVIQDFGASEIGQKLNNFKEADGLIQTTVNEKVKACGIDPKM